LGLCVGGGGLGNIWQFCMLTGGNIGGWNAPPGPWHRHCLKGGLHTVCVLTERVKIFVKK